MQTLRRVPPAAQALIMSVLVGVSLVLTSWLAVS
jgi:hypothetical protein